MSYLTYAEILKKVVEPLDLQDEVFIGSDEMRGYCNDAIKKCESKIHTIYEDYFLTRGFLTITQGSQEVNFPADMYANKLRSIVWAEGPGSRDVYEVKRIKDVKKFIRIEEALANDTTSDYRYWIMNSSPAQDGRKIMLVPPARETTSTKLAVYYIRRANQVVDEDSLVDIPEYYSVIVAYMRYMAYLKEGHPNTGEMKEVYVSEEKDMIETLTEMVPDGENEISIGADPYDGGLEP